MPVIGDRRVENTVDLEDVVENVPEGADVPYVDDIGSDTVITKDDYGTVVSGSPQAVSAMEDRDLKDFS